MNTYIFLYQETSLFEIDLVAYFMKTKGNVYIVSETDKIINTNEGISVVANKDIDNIDIDDIDVFVICGGNIENIKSLDKLHRIIVECKEKKKIVGGICAGKEIVTKALNIKETSDKTMVLENMVLSPGNEYVDFALEIGKLAEIYEDEDDYIETINYFKRFQNVE